MQAWSPEFNALTPHAGRRKFISAACPLMATCASWHAHSNNTYSKGKILKNNNLIHCSKWYWQISAKTKAQARILILCQYVPKYQKKFWQTLHYIVFIPSNEGGKWAKTSPVLARFRSGFHLHYSSWNSHIFLLQISPLSLSTLDGGRNTLSYLFKINVVIETIPFVN